MKWLGLSLLLIMTAAGSGCDFAGMIVGLGTGALSSTGNVQTSSRAVEELFLGAGEGPSMYRYAEDLFYQGRYREAVTAYYHCEAGAYTTALQEAARARRMYLQELILAYETGVPAEPPPVVDNRSRLQLAPKPIYDKPDFYGRSDVSIVSAHPRQLKPSKHYIQDRAAYHIYGYPAYPGDISSRQVELPERPPYSEE